MNHHKSVVQGPFISSENEHRGQVGHSFQIIRLIIGVVRCDEMDV